MVDQTISLGNILSAGATLIAIFIATYKVMGRLGVMEMKLNLIWMWYKKEYKIEEDHE